MRQGREGRHKSLCPQTSYPNDQMELNPTMEENLGAYEEHTPQNFATQGGKEEPELLNTNSHQLLAEDCYAGQEEVNTWQFRPAGHMGRWAQQPVKALNEMVRLERIGWALTATATIGKRQMRHNGKSTRCDPRSSMFEDKINSIYS